MFKYYNFIILVLVSKVQIQLWVIGFWLKHLTVLTCHSNGMQLEYKCFQWEITTVIQTHSHLIRILDNLSPVGILELIMQFHLPVITLVIGII